MKSRMNPGNNCMSQRKLLQEDDNCPQRENLRKRAQPKIDDTKSG